jgi:hypothetical protein
VIYSQSSSKCVAQFMFPISYIFGKLSRNISDILVHDVRPRGRIILLSWYSVCIFISFTYMCVVWNVAKIHVSWLLFEFHWVAFTNILITFQHLFDIILSCPSTFDCNIQWLS